MCETTVYSYRQKSHRQRRQKADCAGRCSRSLCGEVGGLRMHPQGALEPMARKRRRRGPDEPAPSPRDGGRRRTRRTTTWTGGRSLSLCCGVFCRRRGPPWLPEGDPRRARSGPETPPEPKEEAEKEEDRKRQRVHRFRTQPLRRRAVPPGRPRP